MFVGGLKRLNRHLIGIGINRRLEATVLVGIRLLVGFKASYRSSSKEAYALRALLINQVRNFPCGSSGKLVSLTVPGIMSGYLNGIVRRLKLARSPRNVSSLSFGLFLSVFFRRLGRFVLRESHRVSNLIFNLATGERDALDLHLKGAVINLAL